MSLCGWVGVGGVGVLVECVGMLYSVEMQESELSLMLNQQKQKENVQKENVHQQQQAMARRCCCRWVLGGGLGGALAAWC